MNPTSIENSEEENKINIESLFEKYETSSQEEKKKILDLVNDKNIEEETEKVISGFSSKEDLANQLLDILPLYYDKSCIWWRWKALTRKWEIIDEVDLMNHVSFSSQANTINSRERGEILQALKQKARERAPKEAPTSWIQFGKLIIDIQTGDKFEASPDYFLTNPCPYNLGNTEETPTIDKIFCEWVGENKVLLLKQIIAYCLIRDYPISRIFCFIGEGSNGKSCFLNLLRKFIGSENVCSSELDTLLTSRFEITKLHKKMVCQMGETNFNEMNKTSILKKLSGNDLIGFEYKNKTPFEAKNFAKILIATNNLPVTTDKTLGFYRRWCIVDFPNQFSEKKDILADIPEEEYENLALQCVGILIDLLKDRKFHEEGSITDRAKKYEDHSNPLEKFWKENIIEDFDEFVFKHEFKNKLNDWCKENRFREISDRTLIAFMKEKGIVETKKQADWFTNEGKKPYIRAWNGFKFKEISGFSGISGQIPYNTPIGELSGNRVEKSEKSETSIKVKDEGLLNEP